jgi:hypothetical protein
MPEARLTARKLCFIGAQYPQLKMAYIEDERTAQYGKRDLIENRDFEQSRAAARNQKPDQHYVRI